ncbi:MAG: hypothetical protein ABSH12_09755 [Endomicrobiales bacterium]|jgi:DNA anti-recombination protein RmuC
MKKSKKDSNEPVTKKEFNERLNEVDERFKKIDERFKKVDERFDKVDGRFDKIELALHNQAKELIRLNEKTDVMATKDDVHKILSAVDNIARNIIDVERKSIVNTHRIIELETTVSTIDKRVSLLESTLHK